MTDKTENLEMKSLLTSDDVSKGIVLIEKSSEGKIDPRIVANLETFKNEERNRLLYFSKHNIDDPLTLLDQAEFEYDKMSYYNKIKEQIKDSSLFDNQMYNSVAYAENVKMRCLSTWDYITSEIALTQKAQDEKVDHQVLTDLEFLLTNIGYNLENFGNQKRERSKYFMKHRTYDSSTELDQAEFQYNSVSYYNENKIKIKGFLLTNNLTVGHLLTLKEVILILYNNEYIRHLIIEILKEQSNLSNQEKEIVDLYIIVFYKKDNEFESVCINSIKNKLNKKLVDLTMHIMKIEIADCCRTLRSTMFYDQEQKTKNIKSISTKLKSIRQDYNMPDNLAGLIEKYRVVIDSGDFEKPDLTEFHFNLQTVLQNLEDEIMRYYQDLKLLTTELFEINWFEFCNRNEYLKELKEEKTRMIIDEEAFLAIENEAFIFPKVNVGVDENFMYLFDSYRNNVKKEPRYQMIKENFLAKPAVFGKELIDLNLIKMINERRRRFFFLAILINERSDDIIHVKLMQKFFLYYLNDWHNMENLFKRSYINNLTEEDYEDMNYTLMRELANITRDAMGMVINLTEDKNKQMQPIIAKINKIRATSRLSESYDKALESIVEIINTGKGKIVMTEKMTRGQQKTIKDLENTVKKVLNIPDMMLMVPIENIGLDIFDLPTQFVFGRKVSIVVIDYNNAERAQKLTRDEIKLLANCLMKQWYNVIVVHQRQVKPLNLMGVSEIIVDDYDHDDLVIVRLMNIDPNIVVISKDKFSEFSSLYYCESCNREFIRLNESCNCQGVKKLSTMLKNLYYCIKVTPKGFVFNSDKFLANNQDLIAKRYAISLNNFVLQVTTIMNNKNFVITLNAFIGSPIVKWQEEICEEVLSYTGELGQTHNTLIFLNHATNSSFVLMLGDKKVAVMIDYHAKLIDSTYKQNVIIVQGGFEFESRFHSQGFMWEIKPTNQIISISFTKDSLKKNLCFVKVLQS